MTTNSHEQGGIHARRIEADNVVSGFQIQGDGGQSSAALVQLAQSIRQGDIRDDEIKARHLVSGLQYIADPSQASVDDLRHCHSTGSPCHHTLATHTKAPGRLA